MKASTVLTNLRNIRLESKLSQQTVSESIGQNSQTIVSRYENGVNSPTLDTLCKWVSALDCEIIIQRKQP